MTWSHEGTDVVFYMTKIDFFYEIALCEHKDVNMDNINNLSKMLDRQIWRYAYDYTFDGYVDDYRDITVNERHIEVFQFPSYIKENDVLTLKYQEVIKVNGESDILRISFKNPM